jgi:hypothetical protein
MAKVLTVNIEKKLWIKFKERVPRSITLNDAVVKLIEKEVNKK